MLISFLKYLSKQLYHMPDFSSLSAIYLHKVILNLSYVSAPCLFVCLGCMNCFLRDNEMLQDFAELTTLLIKFFVEHYMVELLKKKISCLSFQLHEEFEHMPTPFYFLPNFTVFSPGTRWEFLRLFL